MQKKLRISVLAGGPSSEHEVSLSSAKMVMRHLDKKKYRPKLLVIGKTKLVDLARVIKNIKQLKCDFAFIILLEETPGRGLLAARYTMRMARPRARG